MKNSIFLSISFVCVLILSSFTVLLGQSASTELNIRDIITEEHKPILSAASAGDHNPGDPIGTWPKCVTPANVSYYYKQDSLIVSWNYDIATKATSDFELSLQIEGDNRSEKTIFLQQGRYSMQVPKSFRDSDITIKLRRRCYLPNDEYQYSNWVQAAAVAASCDPGTIGYNDSICSGDPIPTIFSITPGSSNPLSYKWYRSFNGVDYYSINNTNVPSYTPTYLAEHNYFKRSINNGACFSNGVYIYKDMVINCNNFDPEIKQDNILCPGSLVDIYFTCTAHSYLWSTGATSDTILVNPTSTTNYSLTVTSTSGCTKVYNRTVQVIPQIQNITAKAMF